MFGKGKKGQVEEEGSVGGDEWKWEVQGKLNEGEKKLQEIEKNVSGSSVPECS